MNNAQVLWIKVWGIAALQGAILPLFCQTPKTFVISKLCSLYQEKDYSIFF